ncbi:MAG: hypothetical protein K1X64_17210 [Myxococcaceae bacterium]|nr:hypothetical protein [Myxococcaceae bacterium]
MAKTATPKARRTKSEIQNEFEKITEESLQRTEAADAKSDAAASFHEAEIRASTATVTVEAVAQRISSLNVDISKALNEVTTQLTAEVRQLLQLKEAVALERKELERLHQIDVASTSIDHLVEDHKARRQQLEAEMATERSAWLEEKQAAVREQKELDEAVKKQRQREADEYDYKKAQERKKAQDGYDESVRLREKQNQEKQQALEKSWTERDEALKTREREWADLRAQVDALPQKMKEEREQAATHAAAATRSQLEQQIMLLKKDAEADRKLAEMRIQSLEASNAHQAAQVELLAKQLDDAKRQVQDIAVKAIEGASGAKALAHINQIAMEQAKTRLGQT